MEKEFIPFEQSKILKHDLDYSGESLGWYTINKELYFGKDVRPYEDFNFMYPAPTFSQAFRWFREKLITKIITSERGDYIEGNFTLLPLIFLNKYEIRVIGESVSYYIDKTIGRNIPFYKEPLHRFTESVPTYEEAQLACLKRMIQIVKNK